MIKNVPDNSDNENDVKNVSSLTHYSLHLRPVKTQLGGNVIDGLQSFNLLPS